MIGAFIIFLVIAIGLFVNRRKIVGYLLEGQRSNPRRRNYQYSRLSEAWSSFFGLTISLLAESLYCFRSLFLRLFCRVISRERWYIDQIWLLHCSLPHNRRVVNSWIWSPMTLEYFRLYLSQAYMAYGKHKRKYSRVLGDQIHEFITLRFWRRLRSKSQIWAIYHHLREKNSTK